MPDAIDRVALIRDRRVQYETDGLEVGDVDADPMEQWHRWHDDAASAGVAEPNAMTLSTVAIYTNYNSAKSRQMHANPSVALTFSWLDLHRQVRVRGTATRVAEGQSDAYFASRPRASQIGAWASPQSETIGSRGDINRLVAEQTDKFDGVVDVPRPPHWGGWLVAPVEWEFWQGRPSRLHDRLRYFRPADKWQIERLAP
jgi:pyridoxamine 5'-phosphate oxidase